MTRRKPWVVSVKALVQNTAGETLCVRKDEHDRRWEIPGGAIDVVEAPEATLARELREELGWEAPQIGEIVASAPAEPLAPYPDMLYLLYRVRSDERITLSGEHRDAAHLSAERIASLAEDGSFNPALAALIARAS